MALAHAERPELEIQGLLHGGARSSRSSRSRGWIAEVRSGFLEARSPS